MVRVASKIFALVLIAGSVSAFAARQDINQETVRAYGGFPYKITKSGSYKLTSNLVVPAGKDGIDVMAPDVTIDLNGFGIIGQVECTDDSPAVCPAASSGIGIASVGATPETRFPDVKVLNGFVRGMGAQGIFLTGDGSLVEKVSVRSNAGAGMIVAGMVLNSSAIGNGSNGIFAISVRDSEAASNAGDGIDLDGVGGAAMNDLSSLNGGVGVRPANGSVMNSTITLNKGAGIFATCPSALMNNTIVANASSISMQDQGCVLENNGTRNP